MPRRGGLGPNRTWVFAVAAGFLVPSHGNGAAPAAAAPSGATPPIELKLPADVVYGRTVGADSAVTFRHGTHVAFAGNRCTGCHPRPFRILTPTLRITHREMNAGGSCGACHNGQQAFGVRDRQSCIACHSGMPAARLAAKDSVLGRAAEASSPGLPGPIGYPRGDASPGQVTFKHPTHLGDKSACATCHPKPFAMKRPAGHRLAGAMHEPSACGMCHDGAKAFGVEDPETCARCHVEPGAAP